MIKFNDQTENYALSKKHVPVNFFGYPSDLSTIGLLHFHDIVIIVNKKILWHKNLK